MKKNLLSFLVISMIALSAFGQTVVFNETFEQPSLADSVVSSGTSPNFHWGISTNFAKTGQRCDTSYVRAADTTHMTTIAFSTIGYSNVMLSFSHICKIEYLDAAEIFVSNNNGVSWIKLTAAQYLGAGYFGTSGDKFSSVTYPTDWEPSNNAAIPTNAWWKDEIFDISAFVANSSQVKIRFLLRDGGINGSGGTYGWLIDDIKVTCAASELNPPVITYAIPVLADTVYSTGPFTLNAEITDQSGIDTAYVIYTVNSGTPDTIGMTHVSGNIYSAVLPSHTYNTLICYRIVAVDATVSQNMASLPTAGCKSMLILQGPSLITIGTGTLVNTTTSYPTPYGAYYWGNKNQFLILASELNAAGLAPGQITSLAFDVVSPAGQPLTAFEVKLGHTTQSALTSTYIANLTSVYSASSYTTVAGWNTHVFQTPFVWNGTDNLVIETCFNNSNYTTNAIVNQTSTSFVSTTWTNQDASTVCASTSGSTISQRPNIRLTYPVTNYSQDAGIGQIASPTGIVLANSNLPVSVRVKNFGTTALAKATISYSVDGVAQGTPFVWTGNLSQGVSSSLISLGNISITPGAHTLKVWTTMPNDSTDQNNNNDTSSVSLYACAQILNGTYTIGGTNPDFATVDAALTAMQNCGISGPVVFNIASGTYTGQLTFPAVPGVSAANTITFQSAATNKNLVTFQYAAIGSGDNFVFNVSGGRFYRFKNITIKATGASYGYAVLMNNGGNNNTFDNCRIEVPAGTTSSFVPVYTIYNNPTDSNTFINNEIVNGYYGFYLYTGSTAPRRAWVISNNQFNGFYYYGVYGYYTDSLVIEGNTMTNSATSGTCYFLYLYGNQNYASISRNILTATNTGTFYGIYLGGNTTWAMNPVIIANNFISQQNSTGTNYPFYLSSANSVNVVYNSVNTLGGAPASTRAFYSSGGANINVINNIFSCPNGGMPFYVATPTAVTASDHNNYHTTGTILAYWNNNIPNLTALKAANLMDSNSVTVAPGFMSNTDLHVNNPLLNAIGKPLVYVTNDIDNEVRHATTPDIGADEFVIANDDAGIANLVNPNYPCPGSANPIIVELRNYGLDTLYTVNIHWSINDTVKPVLAHTDSLPSGGSRNILLGNYTFVPGITYNLKFYTSMPNGVVDIKNTNDTVSKAGIMTALPSGTYTLGTAASDFLTINDAVNAMVANGICGPVVFNIASGTYTGQYTIPFIPGASAVNTITFKSATGNKANVVLQYAAAASADNFVLRFNGAKYITFKQLTISATGTTYGYGAVFTAGSYNSIDECIVQTDALSTSSSFVPVYSTTTGTNNNTVISNSTLIGGYYGIYWYGSSAMRKNHLVFDNNNIEDYYYYGIYTYYADSLYITRNKITNRSSASSVYPTYIGYTNGFSLVSRNHWIVTSTSTSYGLYIAYKQAVSTNSLIISNNFYSQTGNLTGTAYGFYILGSNYVDIYNNSVLIAGASATGGRAFYQSAGSYINIKNHC